MKRFWVEYRDAWAHSPMTYWVHRQAEGEPWYRARLFTPPAPPPVPGKGWPAYYVECDRFVFHFASLHELDACIEALSRRVLPNTRRLAGQRGEPHGPNAHWLSRLPARTKSWRYRRKAVSLLEEARRHFLEAAGLGPAS